MLLTWFLLVALMLAAGESSQTGKVVTFTEK